MSSNKSKGSPPPHISRHLSRREEIVHRLYDVRGTPGSGKTTLLNLLHVHILEQNPSALVYTKHSWLREVDPSDSESKRLRQVDPGYPRRHGLAFLLLDEGQYTYQDEFLWSHFLKGVSDGLFYRYQVILFCSYGTPFSRPVNHQRMGAPLVLCGAASISLWPQEFVFPRDRSIGLLLNRSEFDEVVSRFECPLNLHPDLLDLIFDWTVGHAGAVRELLCVISYQNVSRVQFTVDAFHERNPTHKLVRELHDGAFGRGLPLDNELSTQPDVSVLFRTLLRDGAVDRHGCTDETEVIRKCHNQGWIHADLTEDEIFARYMFPSPLHAACLSWLLEPTTDILHFASVFDLSLETISNISPSQLRLPRFRRVGDRSVISEEAQYEDKLYLSIFAVTSGNVRFSPEFAASTHGTQATASRAISLFIPVVKWGIELTRNGSRLTDLERSSRFANPEAYGAWLKSGDMTDYILLDCRTSIPTTKYPSIPNLFHVVFNDGYQEVAVYNNMAELVKGPIVLQNGNQ